jgi:HPt (histidine-containing phosphotransfer) domain-containing protein
MAPEAGFKGDPAIIDLAIPARTLNYNPEKIRRVAHKFLESTRNDLTRMDAALAAGDLEELSALGHRLKSPARALGAMGLADLCQGLEALREGGDRHQAGNIVAQLRPLLEEIARRLGRHPMLTNTPEAMA